MSIVVNTPTGHIGSRLTSKLLDAGKQVTIIARDAAKVKHFAEQGARVVVGAVDDEKTLQDAFKGAKSLFWLTPPVAMPDYGTWSAKISNQAAKLAKAAGIEHALIISSVGSQNGGGVISIFPDVERAFNAQVKNVAVLRPAFFFENFLRDVGSVASQGVVYTPIPANAPIAAVATSDIADRAFSYLSAGWRGQFTVGVLGPQDTTWEQAWQTIGKVIGKEVKIVNVTLEQAKQGMLAAGMPEWLVSPWFTEFYGKWLDGSSFIAEPRTPDTTTPTTLAEWARQVFKPAYEAAGKK